MEQLCCLLNPQNICAACRYTICQTCWEEKANSECTKNTVSTMKGKHFWTSVKNFDPKQYLFPI